MSDSDTPATGQRAPAQGAAADRPAAAQPLAPTAQPAAQRPQPVPDVVYRPLSEATAKKVLERLDIPHGKEIAVEVEVVDVVADDITIVQGKLQRSQKGSPYWLNMSGEVYMLPQAIAAKELLVAAIRKSTKRARSTDRQDAATTRQPRAEESAAAAEDDHPARAEGYPRGFVENITAVTSGLLMSFVQKQNDSREVATVKGVGELMGVKIASIGEHLVPVHLPGFLIYFSPCHVLGEVATASWTKSDETDVEKRIESTKAVMKQNLIKRELFHNGVLENKTGDKKAQVAHWHAEQVLDMQLKIYDEELIRASKMSGQPTKAQWEGLFTRAIMAMVEAAEYRHGHIAGGCEVLQRHHALRNAMPPQFNPAKVWPNTVLKSEDKALVEFRPWLP